MKLTRVGVDLAKQVFQVHGVDRAERPAWCKRLKRARWIADLERDVEPGCEIGMEACGGAHHWARVLCAKGYRVLTGELTAALARLLRDAQHGTLPP